ncbi:MAG TPA: YceI family protein [Pseudobdellovibrionaceae bacterium]|nr:YceI family protein [Pseudobdellovibrionaceae bacterium]
MKPLITTAAAVLMSIPAMSQTIEAGSYKVDPAHSKVGFEIPHLVISTVEGNFRSYEGTIDLKGKFETSTVSIRADVASIDTGIKDRDDHLKSADFFDVAKYPKMTFQSASLKGTPESFRLTGDLTIRGTKKKVTFEGKYLGSVKDAYGQQKVAFVATAKISRKDFGLKWNSLVEAGPVVGDEVTIKLSIQGAKPASAEKG